MFCCVDIQPRAIWFCHWIKKPTTGKFSFRKLWYKLNVACVWVCDLGICCVKLLSCQTLNVFVFFSSLLYSNANTPNIFYVNSVVFFGRQSPVNWMKFECANWVFCVTQTFLSLSLSQTHTPLLCVCGNFVLFKRSTNDNNIVEETGNCLKMIETNDRRRSDSPLLNACSPCMRNRDENMSDERGNRMRASWKWNESGVHYEFGFYFLLFSSLFFFVRVS